MKGLILTAALLLSSTAAFANGSFVASLPSPNQEVSGVVESHQPECACSPIVVLVDGDLRTLVSADESFLRSLAKKEGQPVTVGGTLETYVNDETGVVKHVLAADRVVDSRSAKK